MPCALAAVLLPESRAHGCHMQETLFPGQSPHVRGGIRAGPVPACGVHSCGVVGRRESERRPGCRESVTGTTGRRRPLVACCSQRDWPWGGSQHVGEWWAGRHCVFPRCGVGYAWTLGVVRHPVGLSGMLLRWPSGAFGSCCIESRWIKETLLTMRTLRVTRS
jgi:hypothetical protein